MSLQKIKQVAVIGAGTMGEGIAQVVAMAGYEVKLFDIDLIKSKKSIEKIHQSLEKLVANQKIKSEQKEKAFDHLSFVEKIEELKNSQLVIEAVVERLDIKKQVLAQLEKIVNPSSIIASNTSSISITQLASGAQHVNRIAGLHFFNPATLMKLVEVVQGIETSEETIQSLIDFVKSIGKMAIVTKDSPGFIVNRVARHYYVESLKVLEENIANIESIDQLLEATGFKMGPFKLMDLIGNDINYSVTTSLFQAFHYDPKFRPSRIQQQKVEAGHLGRKTGKGFYDYSK
jgi:3-hydroxybutyryl-CoA dehydrogenase